VQVRDPGLPDESSVEPPTEVTFRVPTAVMVIKFAGAALVAVAALFTGDALAVLVGLATAAALGLLALRDVLARDRLRADAGGLELVCGYAAKRHLDWDAVDRMRIDDRLRLGVRSRLLEVDADEQLYLFSRYDLGVEPTDALAALLQVRGDR
jgi:PH (Pleckstrin Homology) domain-containing protein